MPPLRDRTAFSKPRIWKCKRLFVACAVGQLILGVCWPNCTNFPFKFGLRRSPRGPLCSYFSVFDVVKFQKITYCVQVRLWQLDVG